MIKKEYRVIGLMSGTSLDGIDLVYAIFDFGDKISFTIKYAETIPYTISWKKRLGSLVYLDEKQLGEIDSSYTDLISEVIKKFIKNIILLILMLFAVMVILLCIGLTRG